MIFGIQKYMDIYLWYFILVLYFLKYINIIKVKKQIQYLYIMLFFSALGSIFNLIYSILILAQPNIISSILYLSTTLIMMSMKYYYSLDNNNYR